MSILACVGAAYAALFSLVAIAGIAKIKSDRYWRD